MPSLAEELPNQINRVRDIQKNYLELRGRPNVIVEPQIEIMEQSIRAAILAACNGDIIQILAAHEDLKGYSE